VPRPRRLLALAAITALALSASAAMADLATEKEALDTRIERLHEQIAVAKEREDVLTSDIAAASEQIDVISGRVDELAAKVAELEEELAEHRARLAELRELYERQTRILTILEEDERIAQERLASRVVEIYTTGRPSAIEVLLSVSSLDDLISQLEYLDDIARRDQEIADEVAQARRELAAERRRTEQIKGEEARTTAIVAERTAEQREALGELVARRDELVAAQADRESLLASVRGERHEAQEDLEALERASAELADRIRAAQAGGASGATAGTGARPSSGLIWPVNGPLTSGFGMRWGRLHAGIDIGVGYGTPIQAAAAGTVIHAGWLGGYGNLVVVDHGGGLSTAYAHQQRIYVGVGQAVAQGEALGEVGNTGHSFGPHLHFEVRVNGNPVDPLGYL
jgi:murein DD-endopeptidase MepM/ murein hydrolase activator NlpD